MRHITLLTLIPALAASAAAQTAIMREGDPAPSGVAGQMVTGVSNSATSEANGYAFRYSTEGPAGTIQGFYGNVAGGPGAVIREEQVFGVLTQTAFEFNLGINSTQLCYSAACDEAGGSTGLDSVWVDDVPFVLEESMLPGTTDFLVNASAPRITETGVPSYVAGFASTSGGSGVEGEALFLGMTRILGKDDVLPNYTEPLDASPVSDEYRFSAAGTNLIVEVQLLAASTDDGAIVVNGAGLLMGGSLVRENVLMPTSVGGNGVELWDNFDFTGINESGAYMFTGDTNGDSALDEFIVRNGVAWAREGDIIDGEYVLGSIEAAVLSEANEMAYVWDIEDGSGGTLEALFLDRNLLIKEGDPVDWDGDGVLDLGVTLADFTGSNSISLTSSSVVYFSADCDVNGTVMEGLFSIDGSREIGTNYCAANANSTGMTGTLVGSGSDIVANNALVLEAGSLPPLSFGFFITSTVQGFVMNPGGSAGNLCLGGSIGRYVGPGQIQNSGAGGEFSLAIDFATMPSPTGSVPAAAGETWNFQAWHRDTVMGTPTSNFTPGLEITLQ